ncbi:MAG: hypothetical protein V3U90_08550 [Dehalococcoidia bacterium]
MDLLKELTKEPVPKEMTFHLPISNRYPGKCGIGFSETILVTETGCEILTCHQPRELAIIQA